MEERVNACLALLAKGCPVREVCRILKISSKTVSSIRKNEYHPQKCGHPPVITHEHISFIEVNSLADARLTDGEIAEMTQKKVSYFGVSYDCLPHQTEAGLRLQAPQGNAGPDERSGPCPSRVLPVGVVAPG